MPITVLTGQPGNGKTALLMEMLMAAAEKGERPIFAAGIDGLAPGLATVLDDPREWNAKDADGNYIVPDGSLIFIDEAWKWFGHLHEASRQATPKHVLDLAEHRHRGLDFVWTTQQPNQIYPFVRGLIADHWHVNRRFGTHMIDVYKWGELNEDVKSQAKRELALKTTRTLPTKSFGQYKSASEHTIKAKIPLKVFMLPVVVAAGAGFLYLAYSLLKPDTMAANLTNTEGAAAQAAAPPGAMDGRRAPANATWTTAQQYAEAFTPLVPAMPWTAPAFAGREVTVNPTVTCGIAHAGLDANGEYQDESCLCLTEQGTRYLLDRNAERNDKACRRLAINGQPYNPYREKPQDARPGAGQHPAVMAATAAAPSPVGIGESGQLQAGYGSFRDEPVTVPPADGF